jgi:hypothetical protein
VEQENSHMLRSKRLVLDEAKPLPPPYQPWWALLTDGPDGDPTNSTYERTVAASLGAMASADLRSHTGAPALRILGQRLQAIEGPPNVEMPTTAGPHGGDGRAQLLRGIGLRGYVTPYLTYGAVHPEQLAATIAAATAVAARANGPNARPLLLGALRIAEEAPDDNRRAYDPIVEV